MILYGLEFINFKHFTVMKKFEKVYVGKGHMPQEGMDIVRITLKMEELQKLAYEYEGEQLVTIEVSPMKNPDSFGRTHTAYVNVRVEEEEKPKKKTRKKSSAKKK